MLINFINTCYNILSLHNSTVFNSENDNNIILNVRDYFIGPINEIMSENNQSHQIKGPFLQKEFKIYQKKTLNISFKVDLEF